MLLLLLLLLELLPELHVFIIDFYGGRFTPFAQEKYIMKHTQQKQQQSLLLFLTPQEDIAAGGPPRKEEVVGGGAQTGAAVQRLPHSGSPMTEVDIPGGQ